ncbi:MAG: hypothetical protein HY924_10885 [Elusimicrobia bacterium]|nr:hypothetical protein [Elusimicrobiota bacterium]
MGWKGVAGTLGIVLMSFQNNAKAIPAWVLVFVSLFMTAAVYICVRAWLKSRQENLEAGPGRRPGHGRDQP